MSGPLVQSREARGVGVHGGRVHSKGGVWANGKWAAWEEEVVGYEEESGRGAEEGWFGQVESSEEVEGAAEGKVRWCLTARLGWQGLWSPESHEKGSSQQYRTTLLSDCHWMRQRGARVPRSIRGKVLVERYIRCVPYSLEWLLCLWRQRGQCAPSVKGACHIHPGEERKACRWRIMAWKGKKERQGGGRVATGDKKVKGS